MSEDCPNGSAATESCWCGSYYNVLATGETCTLCPDDDLTTEACSCYDDFSCSVGQ